MGYGDNIILNPGAEENLVSWTTTNVAAIIGGTQGLKCFKLMPNASMVQASDALAFTLQPISFRARAVFHYESIVETASVNVPAFYSITLKYSDPEEAGKIQKDTYLIPFEPTWDSSTGWYVAEAIFDTRMDAILMGYEVEVYTDESAPVILVDELSLEAALDALEVHNQNPNPHNLPLAITVGQHGIKATKGDEIQFWLTDEGDAIFKGEISASQITIGLIGSDQIDIPGLDLLSNPVFTSYASNVDEMGETLSGHATLIQQNASAIVTQAAEFGNRITTTRNELEGLITTVDSKFQNYSTITQTAQEINSAVTSINETITTTKNELEGQITTVDSKLENYSTISQTSTAISSAVSSVNDTITTTKNELTGQINTVNSRFTDYSTTTQTSNMINTRVAAVEGDVNGLYDDLHGRNGVWSEITQLAGEITSIVSFTDVTGAQLVSRISQAPSSVKIDAKNIDLTGITTIYSSDGHSRAQLGGSYGDFNLTYNSNTFFRVTNEVTGVSLGSMGNEFLVASGFGVSAVGTWDFSNTNVVGLDAAVSVRFA